MRALPDSHPMLKVARPPSSTLPTTKGSHLKDIGDYFASAGLCEQAVDAYKKALALLGISSCRSEGWICRAGTSKRPWTPASS